MGFWLMAGRRRIAIDNILSSGIAASRQEARRIALASFRHLGYVVAESFYTDRILSSQTGAEAIVMDMPMTTQKLLSQAGQGVILVSGHLGNWEFGAQALSRSKPLTGVARKMDNPKIQELVTSSKMRHDFETIDKHMASPMDLVRTLRKGRILALLTDQHASAGGIVTPFFGRSAATYTTPAVLHRLTKAPIIFGAPIRLGTLHYRFTISEPLVYDLTTGNKHEVTRRITEDLTRRLEEAIRKNPEQYLWAHRRWKIPSV